VRLGRKGGRDGNLYMRWVMRHVWICELYVFWTSNLIPNTVLRS
jgi:hypothetical protein